MATKPECDIETNLVSRVVQDTETFANIKMVTIICLTAPLSRENDLHSA
jgi:hypothetical protein